MTLALGQGSYLHEYFCGASEAKRHIRITLSVCLSAQHVLPLLA